VSIGGRIAPASASGTIRALDSLCAIRALRNPAQREPTPQIAAAGWTIRLVS
jgi:hypothetical protein